MNNLQDAIYSFEEFETGFISEEFLEDEVKQGLNKIEEIAETNTDEANAIIDEVSDIKSFPKVDDEALLSAVDRGKSKIDVVIDELYIVDDYYSGELEATEDLLHLINSYVDDLQSMFKQGGVSIADIDIKKIENFESYGALQDKINNSGDEVDGKPPKDINQLPLSEIKKGHDEIRSELPEHRQAIVNQAFSQMKNGEITRAEYAQILEEQLRKAIEEGYPSEKFLVNLKHNSIDAAKDLPLDAAIEAVEFSGEQLVNKSGKYDEKTKTDMKYVGNTLRGVGNVAGGVNNIFSFDTGVKDDMEERDKTVGEAISHNLAGIGATSVGGLIGTAIVGATVVLVGAASAPAVVVAGVSFLVGATTYVIFEAAYDSNLLGIQDSLDWVGQKIDAALDNKLGDFVKDVGNAISSGLDSIRSAFSWG